MKPLQNTEKRQTAVTVIFGVLLLLFLTVVLYTNLVMNPTYYDGDSYADMNLAKEIWKAKSLFPKDWVFGNQLSVVSTPALTALLYGACGNVLLAMALASSLMAVLIFLSYDFMLRPFAKPYARMGSFLIMAAHMAACQHLTKGIQGWQLFFTVASYYAAYLITAFLAFGCYVRAKNNLCGKAFGIFLALACVMSFATGLQSARQTEVMVLPLLVCEGAFFLRAKIKKEKISRAALGTCAAIAVSNFAGLVTVRFLHIQQHTIIGETYLLTPSQVIAQAGFFFKSIGKYLICKDFSVVVQAGVFAVLAVSVCGLVLLIRDVVREKRLNAFALLVFVMAIGAAGVAALDLFDAMNIRSIYYFMLYPAAAVPAAYALRALKGKQLAAAALLICVGFSGTVGMRFSTIVKENMGEKTGAVYYEMADVLQSGGFRTIYANWGVGARTVVASRDAFQAGLWLYNNEYDETTVSLVQNELFQPVTYISIPHIFEKEKTEKVAYIVSSRHAEALSEAVQKLGAQITVIGEFRESEQNKYIIFTADRPLCCLTYEAKYGKPIEF